MTRSHIAYVHDGAIVRAPWRGNSHTLIQHLREERHLTGTKEGCAEGDCGACVVLIGELVNARVRYRMANACFMPIAAVHGRLVITVESIGRLGSLHPVQSAMVAEHGSQCGFCTPGFVVSLYELYLRHDSRSPIDDVHDQLSGNLCRCTGYAPILRAADTMHHAPRVVRDEDADAALLVALARDPAVMAGLLERDGEVAWLPRESAEVARLLLDQPDATLAAGSTDVGLWITKQLRTLPRVIHLSLASDLLQVSNDDEGLCIGAAVSLTDAFSALVEVYPEFVELWRRFASPAVRNMGTLGGNIANGSPIGDSMPALMVMGAVLRLRKGESRREVLLESFYLGYQRTALQLGEFVEAIFVPPRRGEMFIRGYKVSKREDDDISAVSLALALRMDSDRVISARIAIGGMAEIPKRAVLTEFALEGRSWDEAAAHAASVAVAEEFEPISDHRASGTYRLRVAQNLFLRALTEFNGSERTRIRQHTAGVTHEQ